MNNKIMDFEKHHFEESRKAFKKNYDELEIATAVIARPISYIGYI